MGLNTIKGTGNWGGAASDLNNNFASITAEIEKLKAANVKFKGYYTTELTLKDAHPSPTVGDNAWVGAEYPGTVYECKTAGTWSNTTKVPSTPSVQLADYATKNLLDVRTTEYNVSVQHPTSGLDGTNKYTLSGAIALIPVALRTIGLKCSFLNVDGKVGTWEYQGGAFTNLESWTQQIRRGELTELEKKFTQYQLLYTTDSNSQIWSNVILIRKGDALVSNASVYRTKFYLDESKKEPYALEGFSQSDGEYIGSSNREWKELSLNSIDVDFLYVSFRKSSESTPDYNIHLVPNSDSFSAYNKIVKADTITKIAEIKEFGTRELIKCSTANIFNKYNYSKLDNYRIGKDGKLYAAEGYCAFDYMPVKESTAIYIKPPLNNNEPIIFYDKQNNRITGYDGAESGVEYIEGKKCHKLTTPLGTCYFRKGLLLSNVDNMMVLEEGKFETFPTSYLEPLFIKSNFLEKTENADSSIEQVIVNVDETIGAPSASAALENKILTMNFSGLKGQKGEQGIQGIEGKQGTQGVQGLQGVQGNSGYSGLEEIEITNNLTQGGESAVLSAEMGKKLETKNRYVYPEDFGAVGDGVADDYSAIQNAINSLTNGGVVAFKAGKTYGIRQRLVIPSNITLLGFNSEIKVLVNAMQNFIVNDGYISSERNYNIKFLGIIFNRQNMSAGGGVGELGIIFHHAENVVIEKCSYISSAAKYAIALGDTKNVLIRDMYFNCGSDAVHLLGKNYNTIVDNLYGVAGDDFVAVTTKDYASYAFEQGDVEGLFVYNIRANNSTRVVLLGNTAHTINDVIIDNVVQEGEGALLNVGDAAVTDEAVYVDNVILRNCQGSLLLRHHNMKRFSIIDSEGSVYLAREIGDASNGTEGMTGKSSIDWLSIQKFKGSVTFEPYVEKLRFFDITDSELTGLSIYGENEIAGINRCLFTNGTNGQRIMIGCKNSKTVSVNNTVIDSVESRNDSVIQTTENSGIEKIIIDRCTIYNSTTSKPLIRGDVKKITIVNTEAHEAQSVYKGISIDKTELNLENSKFIGFNRFIETNYTTEIILNYRNIEFDCFNDPFNMMNSPKLTISGNGIKHNRTKMFTENMPSELRCFSDDFEVDASAVVKEKKAKCFNTNSSYLGGIGLCISDGVSWRNIMTNVVE